MMTAIGSHGSRRWECPVDVEVLVITGFGGAVLLVVDIRGDEGRLEAAWICEAAALLIWAGSGGIPEFAVA